MREKERIRKFCEELADQWETNRPDMRFGQLVVQLNQASNLSRHALYDLEEEEMMQLIRRFFSRDARPAVREDCLDSLIERWQELVRQLQDDGRLDLPSAKALLATTWQYWMDTVDDCGICNLALPMLGAMYVVAGREDYPDGAKPWEFDAYVRIIEALLSALQDPSARNGYAGSFYEGYISVKEWARCEVAVHIGEFARYFDELSETYYKEMYAESYDGDGDSLEDGTKA